MENITIFAHNGSVVEKNRTFPDGKWNLLVSSTFSEFYNFNSVLIGLVGVVLCICICMNNCKPRWCWKTLAVVHQHFCKIYLRSWILSHPYLFHHNSQNTFWKTGKMTDLFKFKFLSDFRLTFEKHPISVQEKFFSR